MLESEQFLWELHQRLGLGSHEMYTTKHRGNNQHIYIYVYVYIYMYIYICCIDHINAIEHIH